MVGIKRRNFIIVSLIIAFSVYVYYSENRHIYDRILIKELNDAITNLNQTIENLKKENSFLEKANQEQNDSKNERILIDCSKPSVVKPKQYKKVEPVEEKELLPTIDAIQLDNDSKLRIKPFFTPEYQLDGAQMTIEKKF